MPTVGGVREPSGRDKKDKKILTEENSVTMPVQEIREQWALGNLKGEDSSRNATVVDSAGNVITTPSGEPVTKNTIRGWTSAYGAISPTEIETRQKEEALAQKAEDFTDLWTSWMETDRAEADVIKYNLQQLEPLVYQQMGLKVAKDESGKITSVSKMSEDELKEGMNELELQQYNLTKETADYNLRALRGELPVSSLLTENIRKQRSQMEETLSRRLGPDWKTTTAGIQAMTEFDRQANIATEEASRGNLTAATGMNLAQQAGLTQQRAATTQGILTGATVSMPGLAAGTQLTGMGGTGTQSYISAASPYSDIANRASQLQMASMQPKQQKSSPWGGVLSMIGTIGAAYLTGGLSLPLTEGAKMIDMGSGYVNAPHY